MMLHTGKPVGADEIATLRDRLLLSPRDIATMLELAGVLQACGDLPGTIDLLQRALRVDPYRCDIARSLGRLWAELGDIARARSWLERALALDPDNAETVAALSALDGAAGLTPAYIRTLFDQYADRFDSELVQTLNYQAPVLIGRLLAQLATPPGGGDILDLGCGTGLSGVALKPFAARLEGVDLSGGMVEKAQRRGVYDALSVAEAIAFLESDQRRRNIIAAVDVLNYLGDLTPIAAAAARRLGPGGLLVGTVEKLEAGDVTLTPKRRYAHSADHVQRAASAAGLTMMSITEATLRTEAGAPVPGLIFAAARKADPSF